MPSSQASKSRPWKRWMHSWAIPVLIALFGVAPAPAVAAAASASTVYVDGASVNGTCSDAYTATQATDPATPWCTISKAVSAVGAGATIDVVPATYHETVVLTPQDDGVTLQGDGGQPIIDGDMVRQAGIKLVNGVHNVTISGFEIENITAFGSADAAGIYSTNTNADVIENNVIHDVHGAGAYSYGVMLGNNDAPGLVNNITVAHNRIFNIGPGGESMGIWLLMTTQMTIENNEIYLVRKEGIRDWCGYDNAITSNRVYLNWVGIALESSVGDYVANNLAYSNVYGLNPKHVSDPNTLTMWGLASAPFTRIWHNTSSQNTYADIALGMNAPEEDYMQVEDNLFADAGAVHVQDFPAIRGPHVFLDGNVYSGSAPLYDTTWSNPSPVVYTTLAQMQSALGWETNGQIAASPVQDAAAGGAALAPTGTSPGVALPDAYGSQVGAVGVAPATMSWTRYPTTVVQSSPEPFYMKPQAAGDGSDYSYWWNGSGTTGSVTFDLGAPMAMNTFVLDVYDHLDPRNPQGYAISVSSDGVNWTKVAAGNNPDSEGSSYKYQLAGTVTARYVRLQILSNFGGTSVIFADFEIGLLSPTGSPQALAALHAASLSQESNIPTKVPGQTTTTAAVNSTQTKTMPVIKPGIGGKSPSTGGAATIGKRPASGGHAGTATRKPAKHRTRAHRRRPHASRTRSWSRHHARRPRAGARGRRARVERRPRPHRACARRQARGRAGARNPPDPSRREPRGAAAGAASRCR